MRVQLVSGPMGPMGGWVTREQWMLAEISVGQQISDFFWLRGIGGSAYFWLLLIKGGGGFATPLCWLTSYVNSPLTVFEFYMKWAENMTICPNSGIFIPVAWGQPTDQSTQSASVSDTESYIAHASIVWQFSSLQRRVLNTARLVIVSSTICLSVCIACQP